MSHPNSILAQSGDALPILSLTDSFNEPTEATATRLARLQTLCLALTAAVTVQQAANVVINEGFAALNATAGSMYLLETDSSAVRAGRSLCAFAPSATAPTTALTMPASPLTPPFLLPAPPRCASPCLWKPPASA